MNRSDKLTRILMWRYLYSSRRESSISLMLKICFCGILIGTFALALIMCIMHGTEVVTHSKLRGIHSTIIMRAYGDDLNIEQIAPILDAEFPEIVAWSPITTKQAIIQDTNSSDITNVVAVKAIDPEKEARTSVIQEKLVSTLDGKQLLATALHDDQIVIGSALAKNLEVSVGDPLVILYAADQEASGNKVRLSQHQAIVGGIFSTGIEEFDNGMLYCSFELLNQLWPDAGVQQVNMNITDNSSEDTIINKLRKRFKLEIYSWKELYTPLVAALKLEKYAMFFILALITLVASLSIISLTFMQITQKRGDIAILKSMGMSDRSLRMVFITVSMIIALSGAVAGLLLAWITGLLLQKYPFIQLPDSYYVSHLPIIMEWHIFALVFVLVAFLSFIAALIPVQQMKRINIAHILRFEA